MRRSSIVAMGLGVVLAVSGPSGAGGAAADVPPGRSCTPEPLEVILPGSQERRLLPELKRAGATGIIVYPLSKVIH